MSDDDRDSQSILAPLSDLEVLLDYNFRSGPLKNQNMLLILRALSPLSCVLEPRMESEAVKELAARAGVEQVEFEAILSRRMEDYIVEQFGFSLGPKINRMFTVMTMSCLADYIKSKMKPVIKA